MKFQHLVTALILTATAGAFAQVPAQAATPAQPAAAAVPAAKDPAATPGIDKRMANQQKRIDQGVASGQLTPKETARLEKREAKLAADTAKAKSDGVVTTAERKRLHREANRDSRAIAKKKHNKQTVAPAASK